MIKKLLSPGQRIATCQQNISQRCWVQHVACVWPPCCDVLRHVGCCWLKFDHFQTWANNTQRVATRRNRVAKRTQHVAPSNVAICCVGMLRSFGRGFRGIFQMFHFRDALVKPFLLEDRAVIDSYQWVVPYSLFKKLFLGRYMFIKIYFCPD